MSHDLLARGDHRLAGEKRGADVVDRRLAPRDRFDDDVDVAREQVVEALGPVQAGKRLRLPGTLVAGAPVGDVGEFERPGEVGAGESPGNGRTDRAKTENADATTRVAIAWTVP